MTLLYCPPCFLDHETGNHPERADRIRRLPERLAAAGLSAQCRTPEFQPVSRQRLARVHSPAYIDEVWAYAKSGGGYIEADTVVSPASYDVALMAAGSVCDAVERLAPRRRQPGPVPRPPARPPRDGQPRHGLLHLQQHRRRRPAGRRRARARPRVDRRLGHSPRQRHASRRFGRNRGSVSSRSIAGRFTPARATATRRAAAAASARRSICPSNSARRGKTISRCSATTSRSSPPRSSRSWCF